MNNGEVNGHSNSERGDPETKNVNTHGHDARETTIQKPRNKGAGIIRHVVGGHPWQRSKGFISSDKRGGTCRNKERKQK